MELGENVVEIGNVSIFLNTERNGKLLLGYGDESEVVDDVVALVNSKIKNNNLLSERVQIHTVTWSRGCLIVEIKLAAIGIALYTFVKDYPDLRKGMQLLSEDLKDIVVVVKKTGVVLHGLVYSQAMPSIDQMKQIVKHAKKQLTSVTSKLLGSQIHDYVTCVDNNISLLDTIAHHINHKYVVYAMASMNNSFSIEAGKIKDELQLPYEISEICTVLGSKMLEDKCNISRTSITGPVNKPDMTFTYSVTGTWGGFALPLIR